MKTRALILTLALLAAALLFASCEDSPTAPQSSGPPPEEFPATYPEIPRPATPDEIIPDESERYTAIVPIAGKNLDFAPVWSAGTFTWNVDIQTQYQYYLDSGWYGDAPGEYWNGTEPNSVMTFEGGVVDLRNPTPFGTSWGEPHPRRLLFVDNGVVLDAPVNPERSYVLFQFQSGYPDRRFDGALFGGYKTLEVDPAFGEKARQRAYYVAAMSCAQLEKPVYMKRERYWKRIPLVSGGSNLKSIRVEPGAQFSVSYSRTQGTEIEHSYTFTRTLNAEVTAQLPNEVLGAKVGGSLSEAYGTNVTVTDEVTVTVERTLTGMDGKTVIYSVWSSVEAYSLVDKDGNPYTDPNFTFSDLGDTDIQGEYEWISSTQFDYE
jgi:hypothetical protein